jgi:3-hydroxy-3-methylglutaryl CoA synthase
MKAWVLILWIHGGYGGTATTAEFETEQACHQAVKALQEKRPYTSLTYVCVPNR